MEIYEPAVTKALADLTLYLNDPRAEVERVIDEPEVPLAELLKREGLDFPANPWLQKAAGTAPEVRDDSRSRRHSTLRTFLLEKIAEGFSVSEIVEHATKVNAQIGAELGVIARELQ